MYFVSADYMNYIYSEVIKHKFEAFRVWMGPSLYIFITKPDDVEVYMLFKYN